MLTGEVSGVVGEIKGIGEWGGEKSGVERLVKRRVELGLES